MVQAPSPGPLPSGRGRRGATKGGTRDGRPSARVVLCKEIVPQPGYVVFYTNYLSSKGQQLADNPRAAAVDRKILADPVHEIVKMWRRPNGLQVGKMRIPLGVIGIIYEARPNVTADAAALCLKSGNAVILRGGSEAHFSNQAIASRRNSPRRCS